MCAWTALLACCVCRLGCSALLSGWHRGGAFDGWFVAAAQRAAHMVSPRLLRCDVCCVCARGAAAAAAALQGGRVPEQKIKLRHGDTLLIDTMEGNTMMNFFKRFLAGGFQVCADPGGGAQTRTWFCFGAHAEGVHGLRPALVELGAALVRRSDGLCIE